LSIKVHYTWIPMLILITALVTLQFAEDYSLFQRMLLGAGVSLLFLATLTFREFILGILAFRKETWVKKITLFAFGGVYQESADRYYATHPPLLYLSRFLFNFLLTAIFYGLYATFVDAGILAIAGIAQWLSYIYFMLFLVHFIPIYPLDGGEVLRLILWKKFGDYYRATWIAGRVGWAAGLILIFTGVLLLIITRQWAIDLLIVLLGGMIQIAAGYTRTLIKIHMTLKTVKAEDIMTRDYPVMSRQVNVRRLIREYILVTGRQYILVVDDGKLKGVLTLNQIKSALRKRQNEATIGDIMTPYEQIRTTYRQQSASVLYEDMYQRSIQYIPVLEENKVIGVVTMSALMNLVKIHSGFGI
jgi:predicted transcriptional regulator/Zn-dependent protease